MMELSSTPKHLLAQLKPPLPWLSQLANTPQDPLWHAEGDVEVHTLRVVQQTQEALQQQDWPLPQKQAVLLAAALHDIGKPSCTRRREIGGQMRIVAPGHPDKGRSYLAYRLGRLGWPHGLQQQVLALVGHHHDPRKWADENRDANSYFHLAEQVPLPMLHLLARADMLGREAHDLPKQLDKLEFFALRAQELGLWHLHSPYREWQTLLEPHLSGLDLQFAMGRARQDHAAQRIQSPQEALARAYGLTQRYGHLLMLCGPSGSGKSTWTQTHWPQAAVVSLDELRHSLGRSRADQSHNGQVMQAAQERLRESLRKHHTVVWDATNLKRAFRQRLLGLAADYGALVTQVVFVCDPQTLEARNRTRPNPIPLNVLQQQIEGAEYPYPYEAHRTLYINEQGQTMGSYGLLD